MATKRPLTPRRQRRAERGEADPSNPDPRAPNRRRSRLQHTGRSEGMIISVIAAHYRGAIATGSSYSGLGFCRDGS